MQLSLDSLLQHEQQNDAMERLKQQRALIVQQAEEQQRLQELQLAEHNTEYQKHIDSIIAQWRNELLELRPYQHKGRIFMRESVRAMNTLPPGLGKTETAMAACYEDDGLTLDGCVGICCPGGLTDMWFDRWLKYWPDTPIVEVSGTRRQRTKALQLAKKGAKVFVFNYEMLHTKTPPKKLSIAQRQRMNNGELTMDDYVDIMEDEARAQLQEARRYDFPGFKYLIFDESHHLKSTNSKRAQAAAELAGTRDMYVWLLSGTPIKRDPDDLYMQLHILMPHEGYNELHPELYFSSYYDFVKQYCVTLPSPYGSQTRVYTARKKPIEELMEKVSFFTSYEEADVYRPPIEEQTINVRMDDKHEDAYNSIERAYMYEEITFHSAMEVMHTLRAVTFTPQKLDTAIDIANGLHNTYDPKHPDLIYGCVFYTIYQQSAHTLANMLNRHFGYDENDPRRIIPLTGEMDTKTRAPILQAMAERKAPFIVGTLGTISEGIDLSYMKAVCFLEETWTHMEIEQGIDRVRRAGSTETKVNVYYLHAVHRDSGRATIDGEIHNVQHHRGMTAEVIVRRIFEKARAAYARKKG